MKLTAVVAVFVSALALTCVPACAQTVIFGDTFENGTGNWAVFPGTPTCTPVQCVSTETDPNCNTTPGGNSAIKFTSTTDRIYHDFALGNWAKSDVVMSVNLYDDGVGNVEIFDIRQSGLRQVLALGKMPFAGLDTSKYQCRVLTAAGGGTGVGWVDTSIDRSVGWHCFEIAQNRSTNTVEFLVDGALGYETNNAFDCQLNRIVIGGGFPSSVSSSTGYLDDAYIYAIPEPSSLLALGTGLLGCLIALKRRRS